MDKGFNLVIPVKQFSSSSIGSFGFCEQKYFISYVLGKREKTGKKALLGTICHKVLEILALCKKFTQDNINESLIKINDEEMGELAFDKEQLFRYKLLSEEEILYLNSINKDKTWMLKPGSKRMGAEIVDELIKTTYEFYKNSHSDLFKFENADFKCVNLWTWTALDYNNGMYDPRNKNVVNPEHEFAFDIDFPWANYDFSIGKEKFSGKLKLKGVIDLVVDLGDDAYEIVDWKTGQRLDWATGEEKTYNKLQSDSQLLIYYYAATKLFPKIKSFILTIFFIRDGGPFSIHFDSHDIKNLDSYLNKFYQTLQDRKVPKLIDPSQNNFKCSKLCEFYKEKVDGTNYCLFIHNEIKSKGIEQTIIDNATSNSPILKK